MPAGFTIETLYVDHKLSVIRYASSFKLRTYAEDIAQETFLRMMRRGSSDIRFPRTYACRTAFNVQSEMWRDKEYYTSQLSSEYDILDEHSDTEANLIEEDGKQFKVDCIKRCLRRLTPCERGVVLRLLNNKSVSEIASDLKIAKTTVRVYQYRAIRKLKRLCRSLQS